MISIHGVRLIDGTGAEPVDRTDLSIDDDRIVGIGPAPRAENPLDLDGLTVMPGLIDAHAHVGLVDLSEEGVYEAPAVMAAKIFAVCSQALDQGFTTVRDAGGVDGGVARAQREGLIRGPRIFPSGPIHCQTGGHGDLRQPFDHHVAHDIPGLVTPSRTVDGPVEMRRAVREAFRHGATQIKVAVSGGATSLTDAIEDVQLTIDELRAAVEEASARSTYVTAHAHNVAGIRNGLEAGVRCFEHASYLDEETAEMIRAQDAAIVPTLVVLEQMESHWEEWGVTKESLARGRALASAMQKAVRIAHDGGLTMGSGSDLLGASQDYRAREIALKADIIGAMPAIISATRTNAQIIGISETTGTIASGMRADLIAVDGDPLEDPRVLDDPEKIVVVMQGGVVVKDLR